MTRLGIEAPVDIEVHRHEILEKVGSGAMAAQSHSVSDAEREHRHRLNNKLNALTLKLQLLQRQISRGTAVEPATQIADVVDQLSDLETAIPDCTVTVCATLSIAINSPYFDKSMSCCSASAIPVKL